jgi:hypothetical protein
MRETSCAGTLEQQQIDIGYSRQRKKATQKKRVFARPLEPRRQSAAKSDCRIGRHNLSNTATG